MTSNKQLNIDYKQICSLNDVSAFLCNLKTEETILKMVISETVDLTKTENSSKYSYERSEMLLNYVWEKLNTGHWSTVDVKWRYIFTVLSVHKVCPIHTHKFLVEHLYSWANPVICVLPPI